MKPPRRKPPPKPRNPAARALGDPLFRPKIVEKPDAYKRRPKFTRKSVDPTEDDQIN